MLCSAKLLPFTAMSGGSYHCLCTRYKALCFLVWYSQSTSFTNKSCMRYVHCVPSVQGRWSNCRLISLYTRIFLKFPSSPIHSFDFRFFRSTASIVYIFAFASRLSVDTARVTQLCAIQQADGAGYFENNPELQKTCLQSSDRSSESS